MAQGDLYWLKAFQRDSQYLQDVLNVYWYEQTSAAGSAADLEDAWREDVRPALLDIQSDNIAYTLIETVNVNDVSDFETVQPTGINGLRVGTQLPPWISWGFRLGRASRASRHGYKRIAGVNEEDTEDGWFDNAAIGTEMTAAIAALWADISYTATGNTYAPRIVKVTRTNPGVLPATYTYTGYPIGSASFYGVTSQNTRKR